MALFKCVGCGSSGYIYSDHHEKANNVSKTVKLTFPRGTYQLTSLVTEGPYYKGSSHFINTVTVTGATVTNEESTEVQWDHSTYQCTVNAPSEWTCSVAWGATGRGTDCTKMLTLVVGKARLSYV